MDLSFVIAELGADWTERAYRLRRSTNELTVLVQQRDESSQEYRDRVVRRVDRIDAGDTLKQIVFLAGSRRDREALRDREQLLDLLRRKASASVEPAAFEFEAGARETPRAPSRIPVAHSAARERARSSYPAPIRT